MISVDEAFKRISEVKVTPLRAIEVSLNEALNHTLAETVIAPISLPSFSQSAMDGYAISIHDSREYRLVNEIKAGDALDPPLLPGDAVRIFTGARVPTAADAVIMQEKVNANDHRVTLEISPESGMNIRPEGEQVQKGTPALLTGTRLTPASVGFLANLGLTKVRVNPKPKVTIVITGSELVEGGRELPPGSVYESNSIMLRSALKNFGCHQVTVVRLPDHFEDICTALEKAITLSDLVLISGGISVGDYDFTGRALESLGVEEIFYKVAHKPGKPLYFGKKNSTALFALPGNPAAAMTCFMVYVYRYLQRLQGEKPEGLSRIQLPLTHYYSRKAGKDAFLKARISEEGVTILGKQSSAMLGGFDGANALACLSAEQAELQKGSLLPVLLLPRF